MKIKSALATQISGSIGGMTGAHNQGGLYLRARSIPVNPQSAQQIAVRNGMTLAMQAWSQTLTDTQRLAWDQYADGSPLVNSLGDQIKVSGVNMFVRSYVPANQAGITPPEDAPPIYGLPAFTAPTLAGNIGDVDVTFGGDDIWVSSDNGYMLVYLSRPVAPSIKYFKGPYRYAGKIAGNSTTPPTSPATIPSPWSGGSPGQYQFAQIRVYLDDALSGVWRGRFLGDF